MSFLLLFSVVFSNVSCNSTRKEIAVVFGFVLTSEVNYPFLHIQFLGFRWTFCRAVLKETEEIISCLAFLSVLHI